MSRSQGLRLVSLALWLALGLLALGARGEVSQAASGDSHWGASEVSCGAAVRAASMAMKGAAEAMQDPSPVDCPDCERQPHCSTCPNTSVTNTAEISFLVFASQKWQPNRVLAPIDVPSSPPDRPPQF